MQEKISIIGAGNIGLAISNGLIDSKLVAPEQMILTRKRVQNLEVYRKKGIHVTGNNLEALAMANVIMISVEPQQVNTLFAEIGPHLDPTRHVLISVVSGLKIAHIRSQIAPEVEIIRAMPNTATGIRESMTCLAADHSDQKGLGLAKTIFGALGQCLVIDEEKMSPATALAACGIAFFLRMIRAASQGGIEIGFHPETALLMAAQTAKGAASLLLELKNHPEYEIDRVTTPRGCTISGLNRMEHEGLSSAIIQGIVQSSIKAAGLYVPEG